MIIYEDFYEEVVYNYIATNSYVTTSGFFNDNFIHVIGLLGFGFGVYTFVESLISKYYNKHAYNILDKYINAEKAERQLDVINMDKEIAEKEKTTLSIQINQFRDYIDNILPIEAERKKIETKMEFHLAQISQHYNDFEKLKSELSNYTPFDLPELPEKISELISSEISPENAKKRKFEKNIFLLIFIFALYIIMSNAFFGHLVRNMGIFLLIVAHKPIMSLIESIFPIARKMKTRIASLFHMIVSFYMLMPAYLSLISIGWQRGSFDIVFQHNFETYFLFGLVIISYSWFMLSMVVFINDVFSHLKTKLLQKRKTIKKIIVVFSYLLTAFAFSIGVFLSLFTSINIERRFSFSLSTYREIVIREFDLFQWSIALILFSLSVLTISLYHKVKRIRHKKTS